MRRVDGEDQRRRCLKNPERERRGASSPVRPKRSVSFDEQSYREQSESPRRRRHEGDRDGQSGSHRRSSRSPSSKRSDQINRDIRRSDGRRRDPDDDEVESSDDDQVECLRPRQRLFSRSGSCKVYNVWNGNDAFAYQRTVEGNVRQGLKLNRSSKKNPDVVGQKETNAACLKCGYLHRMEWFKYSSDQIANYVRTSCPQANENLIQHVVMIVAMQCEYWMEECKNFQELLMDAEKRLKSTTEEVLYLRNSDRLLRNLNARLRRCQNCQCERVDRGPIV